MNDFCVSVARSVVFSETTSPHLAQLAHRALPFCDYISVTLVAQNRQNLLLYPVIDGRWVAQGPLAAVAKCTAGTAAWAAFETGQPLVLAPYARNVVFKDWEFIWRQRGACHLLTAPLAAAEGALGALTVGSSHADALRLERVSTLVDLLSQCLVHAKVKYDLQMALGLLQRVYSQPARVPVDADPSMSEGYVEQSGGQPALMPAQLRAPPQGAPAAGPITAQPQSLKPSEGCVFRFACHCCHAENAVRVRAQDLGLCLLTAASMLPALHDTPAREALKMAPALANSEGLGRDPALEGRYLAWHNAACARSDLIFCIIAMIVILAITFVKPYALADRYPHMWPTAFVFTIPNVVRALQPRRYLAWREWLLAACLAYFGAYTVLVFAEDFLATVDPVKATSLPWILRTAASEALCFLPLGFLIRFKVYLPIQLLNFVVALAGLPRTCGVLYPHGMDELCVLISRFLVLGEAVRPELAELVAQLFPGCEVISVALVGQEGDGLLLYPILDDSGSVAVGQPVAATAKCTSGTAVWAAFETGQLQVLDSHTARAVHFRDWRMLWERQGVRGMVTAPLQAEEGRIGALTVGSSHAEGVNQEQVQVAALLLGLCLVHAKCKHDLQVAASLLQSFSQQVCSPASSQAQPAVAAAQLSLQALPVQWVVTHAPGSCEHPECGVQAGPGPARAQHAVGPPEAAGSEPGVSSAASLTHHGRAFAFRCYACQAENAMHILPEDLGLTRVAEPGPGPLPDPPSGPPPAAYRAATQPHDIGGSRQELDKVPAEYYRKRMEPDVPANHAQLANAPHSNSQAAGAPEISPHPGSMQQRVSKNAQVSALMRSGAGEALGQHPLWQTFRDPAVERDYVAWHDARCTRSDLYYNLITLAGAIAVAFAKPYRLASHCPRTWPLLFVFMIPWVFRCLAPARYLRHREPITAFLLAYCGMVSSHYYLEQLLHIMPPEEWAKWMWMVRMSGAEALSLLCFGLQMRFKVFLPLQTLNVLVALAFLPRTCGLMYPAGAWPGCVGAFSALVVVLGLLVPCALVWYNELRGRRAFLAVAHAA
ncbi:hypothetical protein WJX72_009939 [[Myrmecia] bisecta]|uniref:GAF domain-containing protein n=1 Tax=[Myrmecia] bisecta TaxID=41462 RepID=A0AAW1PC54_9CHLO